MIARGLTNQEIASHLNLSEQTIKHHVHRILRRVGANGRFEVVERMAQENRPSVSDSPAGLARPICGARARDQVGALF